MLNYLWQFYYNGCLIALLLFAVYVFIDFRRPSNDSMPKRIFLTVVMFFTLVIAWPVAIGIGYRIWKKENTPQHVIDLDSGSSCGVRVLLYHTKHKRVSRATKEGIIMFDDADNQVVFCAVKHEAAILYLQIWACNLALYRERNPTFDLLDVPHTRTSLPEIRKKIGEFKGSSRAYAQLNFTQDLS